MVRREPQELRQRGGPTPPPMLAGHGLEVFPCERRPGAMPSPLGPWPVTAPGEETRRRPVTKRDGLDRARDALLRKAWDEAYAGLVDADEAGALDADGLERLAEAAHLVGEDDASAAAWTRAHQAWVALGDAAGAARCAFWLGLGLLLRGEHARGQGWLARAQRVLDQSGKEVVEAGYLRVPDGLNNLDAGDLVAGRVKRLRRRVGSASSSTTRTCSAWPGSARGSA